MYGPLPAASYCLRLHHQRSRRADEFVSPHCVHTRRLKIRSFADLAVCAFQIFAELAVVPESVPCGRTNAALINVLRTALLRVSGEAQTSFSWHDLLYVESDLATEALRRISLFFSQATMPP